MELLNQAEERAVGTAAKGVQAIRMRIAGYSCREIGEQFGVPANHVTAWIAKARKYAILKP